MWDLSVGGSAIAGESSSQAAERELAEELGLKMDLSDVRPQFTTTFRNGFDDYYIVKNDFDDTIPIDFWETLAVYVAHASLYSVKWAEKFGSREIEGMKKRCEIAFENYNNFKEVVPVWYDQTLRLKYAENIK